MPTRLLEERVETAIKVYRLKTQRVQNMTAEPIELIEWSRRLLEARLALQAAVAPDDPKARIKVYESHLEELRGIERLCDQKAKSGLIQVADAEAVKYYRLDAEILLLQAGGKIPEQKDKKESPEKP